MTSAVLPRPTNRPALTAMHQADESPSATASDTPPEGFRMGLTRLFGEYEPTSHSGIRMVEFAAETADEPDWSESMEAVDPTDSITLEQLEALAAAHNPTLQTAAAIAQKAMGVRRQVGRRPNPTVGYRGEEIGIAGQAGLQGAFLSQTIVLGDKLEWNERVADGDIQALLWQAETQRYRVRNDVRRAFYVTLGAQERVNVARELQQIADEGVKNAQVLVDAMQAARPDLLQAQIQLNEVEILRRNAEFEHEAAWRGLANLVGVPTLPLATIDHPLDEDGPLRDRESLRQQLLTGSPQVQQARSEADRARMRIGREQAQVIPNLNVQVATVYADIPDDVAAAVQVGVPVPLLNRNKGNIDRACAEYRRATWNVQRLELQLQSDLAAAWSEYRQAHNRVETIRNDILPREQQTLELIETGYPVQFDFLRVLTARRSYFEARLDLVDALVELRQAEVLLDGLLLTGGLDAVPDPDVNDGLRGRALNGQ